MTGASPTWSTVLENLIVPLPDGSYYLRVRVLSIGNKLGQFKASYVLSYKLRPALPQAPPMAAPANWYRIVPKHSGQVLDVSGNSCNDGAETIQWPRKTGQATNEFWAFIPAGDRSWYIISSRSGKVLDVEGASMAQGAIRKRPRPQRRRQVW